jgi:hypothetical protein
MTTLPAMPSATPSTVPLTGPPLCPSNRKLYLPYSSLRTLLPQGKRDLYSVTVHWFCVNRSAPIAPYASVLLGYKSLSDEARVRAEMLVDEFFREEEFHLLRDYLRERHHEDPRTAMLVIPVSAVKPDTGTRTGTLRPFGMPSANEREEVTIFRLAEEEGYSLPFTVWGAYAATPRSPALSAVSASTPSAKDWEEEETGDEAEE